MTTLHEAELRRPRIRKSRMMRAGLITTLHGTELRRPRLRERRLMKAGPIRALYGGPCRRGLTLLETLISLSLSALVVMAAMALIPAYGYNIKSADEQLLQSRGLNLYVTVHDWLARSESILGTYRVEFAVNSGGTVVPLPEVPGAGVREIALALVTANMGDRNGDGRVNYDEVEGLLWEKNVEYTTQGAIGGSSLQFIRHANNATPMQTPLPECDSGAGADHQWGVPDDWFIDNPGAVQLDRIAVNVVARWSWDPASEVCGLAADPFFIDMNFSLMNIEEYGGGTPWLYSFDVAAATSGASLQGTVD